jgi:hypothetical protein
VDPIRASVSELGFGRFCREEAAAAEELLSFHIWGESEALAGVVVVVVAALRVLAFRFFPEDRSNPKQRHF